MSANIKGVIFDLGRVLVRVDVQRGVLRFLSGHDADDADGIMKKLVENHLFKDYCRGSLTPEEFCERVCDFAELKMPFAEFAEKWCDIFDPMEGMEEILSALCARMPVGLLSDTDPLHWEYLLDRFPMLRMIKCPTLSYRIGHVKPEAECYCIAAENTGLNPQDCLFVDDLEANVQGARKVGMESIRFAGADNLRRQLEDWNLLV